MAKSTQQDVVIRFTGQNLIGPTIQGLQKQLNDAARQSQKYNFMPVGQALNAQYRQRFDEIRKSEERALKLRQFYARKQAELDRQTVSGGYLGRINGGVAKKALGAAGLAAGMVGEIFGDSGAGRAAGAIGNIGGQAALGGMTAGPWGAAIFGSIAALKEFKGAIDDATKSQREAVQWANRQRAMAGGNYVAGSRTLLDEAKSFREGAFPRQINARNEIVERAKQARRMYEYARENPDKFSKEQVDQLRRQRLLILGERESYDNSAGFRASMGLAGRWAGYGLDRLKQLPGVLGDQFMGATAGARFKAGQFAEAFQRNRQIMEGTASPAERYRNELATLEGQFGAGQINQEAYSRAKRKLRLDAIATLPGRQDVPGLQAAVSRTSTRGPEQRLGDEMSKLRKEAKKNSDDQVKALRELLSEYRGEGDQDT